MALLRRLSFMLLIIGLSACGGGDGGLGAGNTPDPDPVEIPITISLTISPDNTTVSEATPLTISAKVMQGDKAISGKLVSFSIDDPELAFFSDNGSMPTGSDGVAEITLYTGSQGGGGQITASIDDGDVINTITFTSAGDGNTGGEIKVATVSLFANTQQIASSGADEITLTAIVKDIDNNLMEGARVIFSADSGDILPEAEFTGPEGRIKATLSTLNAPENRTIQITAISDLVEDSVNVQVVGTTVSLTGSSSLAINDESQYSVVVLDSDGNAIAEEEIILSLTNQSTESASGAVAELTIPSSVTTDYTGHAKVNVTGNSGGTNSIVASALGVSSTKKVAVQADSFLFTDFDNNNGVKVDPSLNSPIPDVLLSDAASVTLTWTRNGVAVPDGTAVNFTATRGLLTAKSATTVNGRVSAEITSSNAGKSLVTFSGVDGNIVLNNQISFEFIAETVSTLVAQASPNSIGPNQQTSTISVVARDMNGNLVKNKTVDFTLSDISNGNIEPANAVTDSNGSASTVYTSGTGSSQGGVSIKARVDEDNVEDTVELTVADRELFISLGTGNEIAELGTTDYIKEYSVFVTDADSNPVNNVELTISAIPHRYYKGYWVPAYDDEGEFVRWITRGADDLEVAVGFSPPRTSINLPAKQCLNEDINLDGILDVGEDFNSDDELTPGNVVAADGVVTTDENGRAIIKITYGQSYAEWLDIKLIASAKVGGTESSAQTIFNLPVFAGDVNSEDISPPFQGVGTRGPFGLLNDCSLNISQDPNIDGT
ncbi:Ig-like domain-containing protein [Colwelliaceae bacterium 6441]